MSTDAHGLIERLNVSRETLTALADFETLVSKWTPIINLVAKSTIGSLRDRHTADSAQLFGLAPINATQWLDLGSGGGFPGIVLAILARELRPALRMTLVEADGRKAVFLREAVRTLGLDAIVNNERIEDLKPQEAEVISARALAPLATILGYAARHLSDGGLALFHKGERSEVEIGAARARWVFEVDSVCSLSDPRSKILMIRKIQREAQR